MEKTYWWRIATLLASGSIVISGLIYETYFCFAMNANYCPFDGIRLSFIEPLFILSLSLLVVSPLLFFIRDEVFLKWLRFSVIWFGVTAVAVAFSPEYAGGWGPSFGPTKESVSIWMASLFVIISLAKITWDSRQRNSTSGFYSK